MVSIASSVAFVSRSALGGSSAPNPRPSPCRLFMSKHLLREIQIRDGSGRTNVIEHDGFTVAWRLRDPHIPGNDGREDLIPQVLLHLALDLTGKAGTPVEHGKDDTLDP